MRDRRVFGQVAQSESTYPWRTKGSCSGRLSRRSVAGCTGDLDVVLCLEDVDSVEKVDESKALQWDGQVFVNKVENVVRNGLCRSCDTEVINLAEKEHPGVGYVS